MLENSRSVILHEMTNYLMRMNPVKVSKVAKIRNRYNQVPHLTQDTNGKVTNSHEDEQNLLPFKTITWVR